MLGIAYKLMYKHIPENLRTQEFWDSLKFMREYTGKVAIIHSYEKPAEWSEEDEIEIGFIIEHLNECKKSDTKGLSVHYDRLINWLKSLRPQPHWKPSEEQMRCLLDCVSKAKEIHNASVGGYDAYRILVSLFDELHKLL